MRNKLICALKNKTAGTVESITILVIVIMILILSMQIVFLVTTGQAVRERCRHSLTLLEASITQDVYDGLQDKDFSYYKSQIVTDNGAGTRLLPKYEDEFIEILHKNLKYSEEDNMYIGEYYQIDADSIDISVENVDENTIKLKVTFDVEYEAYMPFLDRRAIYTSHGTTVTSNYSFNDIYNSEANAEDVTGGGNSYENIS